MMLTVKITGTLAHAKLAEVKPFLGESHQYGAYWRDGALCVDYYRRDEANLVVNGLSTVHGIKAQIVGDPC